MLRRAVLVLGGLTAVATLCFALIPGPDVGVAVITAPPDTVYTGLTYTPACTVENYNIGNRTFPVYSRIESPGLPSYADTHIVYTLPPYSRTFVTFKNWKTPKRAGATWLVTDTTALLNDFYPHNDRKTKYVYVKGDVGTFEALEPLDTVRVGASYTPTVRIMNLLAGYTEVFSITCTITDEGGNVVYWDVVQDSLLPWESALEYFAEWVVTGEGGVVYLLQAWTSMIGDFDPGNNLFRWVVVSATDPNPPPPTPEVRDAGSVRISEPPDTVGVGEVLIPKATVKNYGSQPASFEVNCTIGTYASVRTVTDLAPNDTAALAFNPWSPTTEGDYAMTVWTALAGDQNPPNDTIEKTVSSTSSGVGEDRRPLRGTLSLSVVQNPAHGAVSVRYALPAGQTGTLDVLDATGRVVESRALPASSSASGLRLAPNVPPAHGSRPTASVPPGIYFLRLSTATQSLTAKAVRLD